MTQETSNQSFMNSSLMARKDDTSCKTFERAVEASDLLSVEDNEHRILGLNAMLAAANLDPSSVLLLRHKDTNASKGCSPYELWRDAPERFEDYQSVQSVKQRNRFKRSFWAAFVVNAFDENVFAGIWKTRRSYQISQPNPKPQAPGEFDPPNTLDKYETALTNRLSTLKGKLIIDWGKGKLAWVQHAEKNNKRVLEIRAREEVRWPMLDGRANL
ncbi:hypothetical protein SH139x_002730 [Planctomycetaceae bacterium SH139]